ncbi:MAG: FAD:protein FMN transferase [Blastocatellia bacterium]
MNRHAAICRRACAAMGTRFELILCGDDMRHLDDVAIAVCEEILRLDAALSRYDPRGEIARLNRHAHQRPVRLDHELFALLRRCEQAREQTGGYFDVTQCAALSLDAEQRAAQLTQAGAVVDLGGVGKGYALESARALLARFGVTSAFLHGGTSSALALGDDTWPVSVRHPLQARSQTEWQTGSQPESQPELIVAHLGLRNRAFSCSAARHADQEQSDIVDPLTGVAINGQAACLVIADSAVEAEIYSTALLAMGRERAMRYLENTAISPMDVGWLEPDLRWISATRPA